ncbi:hypothetical protein CAEBREN_00808 [Caenorhabditis brenneri]|uniref:SPK domain-containing protein n=1 Tax=Caenorhabditis brenneri TaxID=135651 RepID=G0P0B7_CAEBE|nr:hypothetical protein CAEBREN_00808 [Caenorhabditis brenneri]
MREPKENKSIDSTRNSPTPSYSSDSIEDYADGSSSTSSLRRTLESMSVQKFGEESQGSQLSESFESIDDLLFFELIEPPTQFDCTADVPLPNVGRHWKDLNNFGHQSEEEEVEETNREEANRDDQGQEEPMEEFAKNKEIIEHLIGVFKTDPKSLKPHGSIFWEKMEHLTGKKASTMVSKFRRELNPMIPSMDLETNLHLEFMKKARTVIKEEVKEKLEKIHGVIIILNPKGRIEKWSQKSQGVRGGQVVGSVKVVNRLVDYSSSEDEPSE